MEGGTNATRRERDLDIGRPAREVPHEEIRRGVLGEGHPGRGQGGRGRDTRTQRA